MRAQWTQSIGNNIKSTITNLDNYGVCTHHFHERDYTAGSEFKSTGLLPFSKPTKFTQSDIVPRQIEEICKYTYEPFHYYCIFLTKN